MLTPFMSCGAKLPVYAAFAVAFSPEHPWKLMLALYLVGIVLGTLVGLVLKRTLFRGTPAHFIMELPPSSWRQATVHRTVAFDCSNLPLLHKNNKTHLVGVGIVVEKCIVF